MKKENTEKSGMIPVFEFEGQTVRVFDQKGGPWFIAQDVCKVLGITNTAQTLQKLNKSDVDSIITNDAINRARKITIISESGLYKVIMVSRKPNAQRFQDWVCGEVLPAIRKTGQYITPPKTQLELIAQMSDLVANTAKHMLEHETRIKAIEERAKEAEDELLFAERSEQPLAPRTTRSKISSLVRAYCIANSVSYRDVWNKVYTEFRDRYHKDLKRQAKNRNVRPMERAEQLDLIEELYAVASHVCKNTSKARK